MWPANDLRPEESPDAKLANTLAVCFAIASYPLFFTVVVPAAGLFLGIYALRMCRDNVAAIAAITLSGFGLVGGMLFWAGFVLAR